MKALGKNPATVERFGGIPVAEIYDQMNEKTKEKIQSVFLHLLKERHFNKISVQHIAQAAGVNRGTFYLHYLDKFDLLDRMEASLLEGLENHLHQLEPGPLLEEAEKGAVSFQAVEVFRYIRQHEEWFRVFLGKHNHSGFHQRLKDFFVRHFTDKMLANPDFFKAVTVPKDYLSAFATSAFLGLIEQWLANDLAESSADMADMYIRIIFFIRNLDGRQQ